MTCVELLRRLDADEPLEAEAHAHAATCAGCRAAIERWAAAQAQLRTWGTEGPPPFLHTRLMAHVRAAAGEAERSPASHRVWWRRLAWAGPALAVVFVGVMGGLTFLRAPWVTAPTRSTADRRALEGTSTPAPLQEREKVQETARATSAPTRPAALAATAPASPPLSSGEGWLEEPNAASEPPAGGVVGGVAGGPAPQASAARPTLVEAQRRQDEEEARDEALRLAEESATRRVERAPAEARAEARAAPEKKQKQEQEVRGYAPAPPAPAAQPADDEALARLRSLGYLDDASSSPATVRCRIVPLHGGRPRLITLAAAEAPAAKRALLFEVQEDGQILLHPNGADSKVARGRADRGEADTPSKSRERRDKGTLKDDSAQAAAVRALDLPPGRYRLERVE